MANIISLRFNNQIEVNTGKLIFTGNETDDTDIGYWIGTEGYASPYTDISTNGEVTNDAVLSPSWNRNTTADASVAISNTADWQFNNYILLPSSISLALRVGSTAAIDFQIELEDEDGNYINIGNFTQVLDSNYTIYNFPVDPSFWSKSFRFNKTFGTTVLIDEIYIYGSFRREDNTRLGLFPANSTIENVKDSQLNINSTTGPLEYLGQLSSKPNIIQQTKRITLSNNITLDNLGEATILTIDPNGVNRDVILPQAPRLDHYIKIINIDGNNSLNIKDTSTGNIIQELSNATTILSLEAIWDQTDGIWHITS